MTRAPRAGEDARVRAQPGQLLEPVKGRAPPWTRQGLCPLDPQQRAKPFAIYQLGFVLRGGPTVTVQRPCRPSPENKPINGFQGPLPLAEFQEAEPLGRGPGRKPRALPKDM